MQSRITVDEILDLAGRLTPLEKLKVIERLAPQLESSLSSRSSTASDLDDQYQRGYEQVQESTEELDALMPHLPLPREKW